MKRDCPRCGSKEPVSVAGCYASAFSNTDRLEGPGYGSRSGTVRPRENLDFLRKDKMVILVNIRNFSRSQMMKRTSPLESSPEI